MTFILAFVVGGLICLIAQLLMDIFKLLPIHVTVLLVIIGSVLEGFNIYDQIVAASGAGALLPIASFGHTMTHSAVEAACNGNYLDIFKGIFQTTSSGISFAVVIAFLVSLIFKPRG